jgi:hypothetical protein
MTTPHELAVEALENCRDELGGMLLLSGNFDLEGVRNHTAMVKAQNAISALRAQKPVDVEKMKDEAKDWYNEKFSKGLFMPCDRQVINGYIDHLSTKYNLTEKE